ncbi:MAG: DNA translocase FtsK [Acholeplasmatales bacterium]|jgi:S-DNA-T family DNA segregation ATPase FtsK/SpoIIIE
MSLFNRKAKTEPIKREEKFSIFQFVKVEGLRTDKKEKFVPTEFISPIFGTAVKDETVAPYVNVNTGDKVKQYDFIRNKPKGDMTTYEEFRSIMLTHESRKEIYGDDVIIDKDRKYVDPRTIKEELKVPYTGKEQEETFADVLGNYEREYREVEIKEPAFIKQDPISEPIYEEPVRKPVVHNVPTYEPKPEPVDLYEPERYQEEPRVTEPLRQPERMFVEPEQPRFEREPVRETRKEYVFPSPEMFSKVDRDQYSRPEWLIEQEDAINRTLTEFNVDGKVKNIVKGPTVTRHEIELEPGIDVSAVVRREANLKMNLAAETIRIEAPIPGKPYIGIEVPNKEPEIVAFGNVVSDAKFLESKKPLMIALGVDIDGENIFADIQKMPHALIGGATNSGKSVCINTIIMSLLMKNHPDDLKFILIDPKMVELTFYKDLPHLATPVITDAKKAATALTWAVDEMEKRFLTFAETRVRDLDSYNEKAKTDRSLKKMPIIVIVIDELADLMMASGQEVEASIQRLTQKARAAGIHLLVATQRPTTDVVKGTIKANIPTRMAFRVAQITDSITILDSAGADQLLGRGDMLLKLVSRPIRLQGAYLKDSEIEDVTNFIKSQMEPDYLIDFPQLETFKQNKEMEEADNLLVPITEYVVREQSASMNKIQTVFEIGFNRAQRIMEILEERGIVSASEGTKARKVLVTPEEMGLD